MNSKPEERPEALAAAVAIAAVAGRLRGRRRQRLAVDQLRERVDSGVQAARVVAVAKVRRHLLGDDPLRERVGHRALEPIADLDPHPAIVFRDDHDDAIVGLAAADLPRFRDAQGELLDRLGLRALHHQHRNLAAFALLERRELLLERRALARGERRRSVDDAAREARHGLLGRERQAREQDRRGEQHSQERPRSRREPPTRARAARREARKRAAEHRERPAHGRLEASPVTTCARSSPAAASRSPTRSRP